MKTHGGGGVESKLMTSDLLELECAVVVGLDQSKSEGLKEQAWD